jgi:tetratricopeptide (TPR) repeat protein
MTKPAPASEYGTDVLLIFVGYSSDGSKAADTIVALEGALQKELDKLRRVNSAIPFRRVKIWKWENDAAAAIGGQAAVVTPELQRANAAVFVFKERVGRVTWEELTIARKRAPTIPVLPFFPASSPAGKRMLETKAADDWADLVRKKRELGADWTELDSIAVTPLPVYKKVEHLAELARERLTDTLVRLLSVYDRWSSPSPVPTDSSPPPVSPRSWSPVVLYPLQPAPYFAGRTDLLADLTRWAVDPIAEVRVVALVAAGGTGKTALAERVVNSLRNHNAAGVFVWSFYENPQTEAFLREACRYFTGSEPKETGGLLERLQGALSGITPHLLILDGLELVQATGGTGRPRGELEDLLMKRLLRWLAAGQSTRAKALITSRFALPDLADWRSHSFQERQLHDLPPEVALAVFSTWGVRGTDKQLRVAIRPLQDERTKQVHALSLSVLGSYLGKMWNGDVTKAPTFKREDFSATDPKAAKLARILTSYAEKLPYADRDLLARLSMFPRGVTVEILGYLIDAGGEVAGRLIGCNQASLLQMLEGLRDLGVVFRYETTQGATYTAHPFLREFFEKLHGVSDPRQIHETVRAKLAPTLEERPNKKPTEPKDLDRYERLIEVTRLAGQTQQAFDLYEFGLGRYVHLGWVLGDNARGLRILSSFATDGTPATAALGLPEKDRAALVTNWGLFALNLGDLSTARRAFEIENDLNRRQSDDRNLSAGFRNLADVELLAGCWPAAQAAAASALTHAQRARDETEQGDSHVYLAHTLVGLGRLTDARLQFQAATKLEHNPPLYAIAGIWEAELKFAAGNRAAACAQTKANQVICRNERWTSVEALCDIVLGRCALPHNATQAGVHLDAARAYAGRSGHIEITLRCYHLAAEIARHESDFSTAVSEALSGIQLADSCEFGHWSIVIRLELARVHLAAGKFQEAIEPASKALAMSEDPERQYAWGIADGLELLGRAHQGLGNTAKANDYLQRAAEKHKLLELPPEDPPAPS